VPSYPAVCFPKKLNNTKLALLKWNSLHFGNIHKKIKETLHLIDIVQQTTHSSSSFEQEISLKMDLDNLLIKKNLYGVQSPEKLGLLAKTSIQSTFTLPPLSKGGQRPLIF
jgi:uncharacterized protein YacL (UPF0231 family)